MKHKRFVSYKFIDAKGNMRHKLVSMGKKLENTNFDGSSFGMCPTSNSDVVLVPDEDSIHWDPILHLDSVFCFIRDPQGCGLANDFRTQAYNYMKKREQADGALFGIEPEFFVCKKDSRDNIFPVGVENMENIVQGDWYGCLPPRDSFWIIRSDICKKLEEAGFEIEGMHHEVGVGQCECSWKCGNLLKISDQMMIFKYIVSNICHDNGLIADFRAKPFKNLNGNGCHVHQSIPMMKDDDRALKWYAQGLVDHYDELVKVCCVDETSKDRLVPGFEAPTKENNGIGRYDRTKTVRIPAGGGRVEFRLPDPSMNPYYALPYMLEFGIESCIRLKHSEASE